MISGLGAGPALATEATSAPRTTDDRLRQAAEDMEGVFVQYLTKALRATVPDGGNPDAPGADMYASLLDEHLAQIVASDTRTGIAEALYRQLSGGREPGQDQSIQTETTSLEGREL